jgi:hypothetical protein
MPARDEADEIGALMLAQLLTRKGIVTRSIPASLASERLQEIARGGMQVVCIAAIPPFGYLHARYLTKRLRQQFPDVRVIVAILSHGDAAELKNREPHIPADDIVTSLQQATSLLIPLATCDHESPEHVAVSS